MVVVGGWGSHVVWPHNVGQGQHVVVLRQFVVAGQADVEVARAVSERYLIEDQRNYPAEVAGQRVPTEIIDFQLVADGALFATAGQRSAPHAEHHFSWRGGLLHAAVHADRIADVPLLAEEAVEVAGGVEEVPRGEDRPEVALVEVKEKMAFGAPEILLVV